MRKVWLLVFLLLSSGLTLGACTHISRHDVSYLPKEKTVLSRDDLTFGEIELRRMLKERPAMDAIIQEHDKIWDWSLRKFAGEAAGQRIYWGGGQLHGKGNDCISEHAYPTDSRRGSISIRERINGELIPCEKLWFSFVYECYNIRNGPKFHAIFLHALECALTEEEFITKNTQLEFQAYRGTAAFFDSKYEPAARQRKISVEPRLWGVYLPGSYEQWISTFHDKNGYPWDYWGTFYRQTVLPYVKKYRISPTP